MKYTAGSPERKAWNEGPTSDRELGVDCRGGVGQIISQRAHHPMIAHIKNELLAFGMGRILDRISRLFDGCLQASERAGENDEKGHMPPTLLFHQTESGRSWLPQACLADRELQLL